MKLFRYYMVRLLKIANEEQRPRKDDRRQNTGSHRISIEGIDNLTEGTRNNTGMTFVIAINYGGRG